MEIKIQHQPSSEDLEKLGVSEWKIWQKKVFKFPWTYDEQETCYFLEGDVIVTPNRGSLVQMGKGDLVTFPARMSCT
jgi:uncharacterized protein